MSRELHDDANASEQKTGIVDALLMQLRPSKPKIVQVYLPMDTPKGVDTALIKMCKDMPYKFEIRKHIHTLQHDVPLIVVCPVTSRLEPDIDHALNGLDWQSDFIALVLHQGNEDSLPGLPTATRLPKNPKYENAKFVDMAYSLEFYACKMNEDAQQEIKKKLDLAYAPSSTDKQTQKTGKIASWFQSLLSKPKIVQVFLPMDTPKGVDTALIKLCKDMSYEFEISKHIHTLQHDVPLIVVCTVTSGLEQDIDHALNALDWQSDFIALVLHQGNEDSLPGLPTATRLPKNPKYENAKFVDMAYSLEFYACKMNEDAQQEIKKKLDLAYAPSSTDKQTQKTGKHCGVSISSRLSESKIIQVYLPMDSPKSVDTALIKMCKDMSYKFETSKHIHTLQHDVPLIVVCPVTSRLEPDIDHALNGLDWQSDYIALVLHQGNEDSLPGLPTATRLPKNPKYENAKFVDMAYSLEFYACKMNEDAKQTIKKKLDLAYAPSSTDKQTQKTGKYGGFSIPSLLSKPKIVQVYLPMDTPKGVDTALVKLCKDMSYEFEMSKHIHALQHDVPLIVVCPVTSRLEPDIDHALNGLDWQSDFIALVLHLGNEDSLPGLPTATRLPKNPKYENAKFVDMAYSLEFYACKMNEDAKQTIKKKLDLAYAPSSTDKQTQKTGKHCGVSISSRLSESKIIQVYLPMDSPKSVDTALIKMCKDMSYKFETSKHIHTLQHDVPLIVVCPVTSRLEPDIDHALNGLDWQSDYIALVLHQGNEDSLPGLPTATRLPKNPKYENAKFVDMAYSLEFYACKMNEDAKQTIKKKLDLAYAPSSTDKQTQKTGKYGGFSIPSLLSKPKIVQVYLPMDTPKGVDTALVKLCKDMSYEFEMSKHIHALQHDVPLIVVCPVTSRLEPDIDHALNGLDWQSDFIALVLHLGNEDSLPGLPTATRLPKNPKYENAKFVDMAYSLEFYACKMNEDAKQTIKKKLDLAYAPSSTDKQTQKTGKYCGFSIPSLLSKPKVVQVYLPMDTPKSVDTALIKLCKDMSYKFETSKHIHTLQHDVPLIVVCPVTSRLEPDIDHALNGLDWQSDFIALVLHLGNEDSLPGLPTATRLPKNSKYENAKFVDIAYSLEFYACKMNEDAKQEIKAFLDSFNK